MLKEVNVSSPEIDGIQWTVNGIMADRRGIVVLYTIQNNTDQKLQMIGLSLKKIKRIITTSPDIAGLAILMHKRQVHLGRPAC